jgi:hypothetical protein
MENKITKEQFDEALRVTIESLENENINIEEEYEKIQNKKSNLSRSKRDVICAIINLRNELGFDLSPKHKVEEHHHCHCHHCHH